MDWNTEVASDWPGTDGREFAAVYKSDCYVHYSGIKSVGAD
jgi:hypothetical protein